MCSIQLFFRQWNYFRLIKRGGIFEAERVTRERRRETVSTKSRKEEEARGNARDSPRDRRTEDMRRARRKVATRLFIIFAVQTTLIEMRYLLEFKGDV